MAVCGDFNVAPEDRDVWDPTQFEGATHVSRSERDALSHIESWGLVDVFRRLYADDQLFSWWDYRAGMFHKHRGMRIDLILVTAVLAERTRYRTHRPECAKRKQTLRSRPSLHRHGRLKKADRTQPRNRESVPIVNFQNCRNYRSQTMKADITYRL